MQVGAGHQGRLLRLGHEPVQDDGAVQPALGDLGGQPVVLGPAPDDADPQAGPPLPEPLGEVEDQPDPLVRDEPRHAHQLRPPVGAPDGPPDGARTGSAGRPARTGPSGTVTPTGTR